MFTITKNTPAIKVQIANALAANGIAVTTKNVGKVFHCHMVTGCGSDVDMCDALAAAFGGDSCDYAAE